MKTQTIGKPQPSSRYLAVCVGVCVIVLVQEVFSIDVSEAAKEGQGVQSVWMSDPHITFNTLDQAGEALELGHHVVWTHKHTFISDSSPNMFGLLRKVI